MKCDSVYIVQINAPSIALHMLQNNTLDAAFVPEPYLTLADSLGMEILVRRQTSLVMLQRSGGGADDGAMLAEMEKFRNAYSEALRLISKHGVSHYKEIISRRCSYSLIR